MRLVRRIVTLALLALPLVSGVGCAAEPPRAPHVLHPIPEDRARQLIARTFREAGLATEVDRVVRVKDTPVRLEVAAAGRSFGVAYLTDADWKEAGDALPARGAKDALVLATGEGGTKILCLFAGDYGEDDQSGDERAASTIAADRRLARDVKDFLHHAEEQAWK
jgi:hypothetical protein